MKRLGVEVFPVTQDVTPDALIYARYQLDEMLFGSSEFWSVSDEQDTLHHRLCFKRLSARAVRKTIQDLRCLVREGSCPVRWKERSALFREWSAFVQRALDHRPGRSQRGALRAIPREVAQCADAAALPRGRSISTAGLRPTSIAVDNTQHGAARNPGTFL